jgi:3-oxoacyl-[acyl-carrier protein] reductase
VLIRDKVVLVTGGARAVGAGIVRSLAREGATVAINCFESVAQANVLADSLRAEGKEASVWQCDAREFGDTRRMVDGIVETHGRIDAVVNNATSGSKVGEWDPEHWQNYINCYEGEVKFVISTLYAAWPYMKTQGGGRIDNIITEQWNEGSSGYITHVAAKAAVVGATRWLVPRLAADNITINMVAPGWTRTERTNGRDTPDNPYVRATPLKRITEAEDVGDACVFFISDLGKYVSGDYLQVNGGRHPQMGS